MLTPATILLNNNNSAEAAQALEDVSPDSYIMGGALSVPKVIFTLPREQPKERLDDVVDEGCVWLGCNDATACTPC